MITGTVVFDKFKNLVIASGKNLYQIFLQADPNDSGVISNVSFKSLIWKLNLGLT